MWTLFEVIFKKNNIVAMQKCEIANIHLVSMEELCYSLFISEEILISDKK